MRSSMILRLFRHKSGYPTISSRLIPQSAFSQISAELSRNHWEISTKIQSTFRYKRLIKAAVREKGPFLEHNSKLASIIEEAKKHGLSDIIINYNVKCTLEPRSKTGMHEIQFPGKGFFVVQYDTVDLAILDHKILKACEPYDASLVSCEGRRHEYYDPRATIVIQKPTGGTLDSKDEENLKKMAGDIEVESSKDQFMVHCIPSKFLHTKKIIEGKGYNIEEAYVGLVRKFTPQLPSTALEQVSNFLTELSELPELDRLFENVL